MYVLIFSRTFFSETFLILRIIQPDISINAHRQSSLDFWRVFRKNQISNFIKNLTVGAEVFLADRERSTDRQVYRETDMTKLFRNFANTPKIGYTWYFIKSCLDINFTKSKEPFEWRQILDNLIGKFQRLVWNPKFLCCLDKSLPPLQPQVSKSSTI